jgi:hypothetical protein
LIHIIFKLLPFKRNSPAARQLKSGFGKQLKTGWPEPTARFGLELLGEITLLGTATG